MTDHDIEDIYDDVFGDREPPAKGIDWFKIATYIVLTVLVISFWLYVMSFML